MIGGAALAGGHVSVAGTLLGVVIVAIITQALVLFHIDPFFVAGRARLPDPLGGRRQSAARGAGSRAWRGSEREFDASPGGARHQQVLPRRAWRCRTCRSTLRGGSIHALLGENGAGKSTLIKIITGVYRPDEGELLLDGAPVRFDGPRDAIAAGIGVVHQERNLIPRFSVGENIMLERLGGELMRPIDYDAVHAEARRWLDLLELDLDPRTPVSRLSVAKMQLVEIAKALSLRSRVLLLDEPTASLTPHETEVAVSPAAQAARRGRRASCSSATSSRRCRRSATKSRSCATAATPAPAGRWRVSAARIWCA